MTSPPAGADGARPGSPVRRTVMPAASKRRRSISPRTARPWPAAGPRCDQRDLLGPEPAQRRSPSRSRPRRRRARRAARGHLAAFVTSRLVHGRASRRPGTGGTAAVVPVASTTAWRAVSICWCRPARSTSTVASPVSRAVPAHELDPGAVEPLHLAGVVDWTVAVVPATTSPGARTRPRRRPPVRLPDAGQGAGWRALDRAQQGLARHAGPVRALAADELVPRPARRSGRRDGRGPRRSPRRAAADHDDVVVHRSPWRSSASVAGSVNSSARRPAAAAPATLSGRSSTSVTSAGAAPS